MMSAARTTVLFWLLGAGCGHAGRPVAPQAAESTVVDSPIYWNEGSVKPGWPVAQGGNLLVRTWSEAAPGCSGIRTREQMVPALGRRTVYPSMTIRQNGAVVAARLQRHNQVTEVDLAPGKYCINIEQYGCLLSVVVPENRGEPLWVQAPDPLEQQQLPLIAVDSASGVVRIDISPPLIERLPRCS